MTFKEGEKVEEKVCPKCGGDLYYEMSFQDQFSYNTGHYTTDVQIEACEKCDWFEVLEHAEGEE